MSEVNSFDKIIVTDDLSKKGITNYTIMPGNDCVWVNYRKGGVSLNCYYIIRQSKIIDIIYD